MKTVLTADELRAVLLQTPAYRNALAILNDEWGSHAQENPLYQAPMSIADLRFVAHLQAVGFHAPVLDFADYSAVSEWIITHQAALTPDVIAWLRRPFD